MEDWEEEEEIKMSLQRLRRIIRDEVYEILDEEGLLKRKRRRGR